MGSDLKTFILSLNHDYFCRNLCSNSRVFSAKRTIQNVRKLFKSDCMNWFEEMEFQKDLRKALNEIEKESFSEQYFVDLMQNIHYKVDFDLIKNNWKRQDVKDFLTFESWNFIEKEYSQEYKFYKKVFNELQTYLKKEKQSL